MTRDEQRIQRRRQAETFLEQRIVIPKRRRRPSRVPQRAPLRAPLRPPLAQDVSQASEGLRDCVAGGQASRSGHFRESQGAT